MAMSTKAEGNLITAHKDATWGKTTMQKSLKDVLNENNLYEDVVD